MLENQKRVDILQNIITDEYFTCCALETFQGKQDVAYIMLDIPEDEANWRIAHKRFV